MHAAPATRHMAGWQDRMVRHTQVHGKTARHEWQDGMAGRTTISTWQDCLPNMARRQGRTVRRHTVAWQDRPSYMAGWQDRTVRHHAGACMKVRRAALFNGKHEKRTIAADLQRDKTYFK
jgi:hypothetical protein